MEALVRRAKEPGWPSMIVFPGQHGVFSLLTKTEGTIENGKCLICFKQGAFTPGTSGSGFGPATK